MGRPSNDSLHYLRLVHQGRTNCWRLGATMPGHTRPIRPIVIAVFSNRVFGVFGLKIFVMVGQMQRCNGVDNLLMMVISGLRMAGM